MASPIRHYPAEGFILIFPSLFLKNASQQNIYNIQFRRLALYPSELRTHDFFTLLQTVQRYPLAFGASLWTLSYQFRILHLDRHLSMSSE